MVLTLEHKHWYHFVWVKKDREENCRKEIKKQNGQQNGVGESSSWSFRLQLHSETIVQEDEELEVWRTIRPVKQTKTVSFLLSLVAFWAHCTNDLSAREYRNYRNNQ